MHSELSAAFSALRERMAVPPLPRAAIVTAAQYAPANSRKRGWTAGAVAILSAFAIAGAAEIATQSHIRFTRAGGMVLSSTAKTQNRVISSENEVKTAAARMNFPVTLPAGLPNGTKPVRLYTSGDDVMAVTYDLPGAWRASHHLMWIFLANPATMAKAEPNSAVYRLRPDGRMSQARWRAGGEEVLVVSNGLTPAEVEAMKLAMQRPAR